MTWRGLSLIGLIALFGAVAGCRQAGPSTPSGKAGGSGSKAIRAPEVAAEPTLQSQAAPPAPDVVKPVASEPVVALSPVSATLKPGDLGLQLLVEGWGEHGGRRDLTGEVRWKVEPAGVVTIEPGGYARPREPGTATVRAVMDDQSAEATITVLGEVERPWDFDNDIVPLFTRHGCNTGGCHAKAAGQNGFHLSLFGYDPAGDYQALVREAGGRRVSRLDPDHSLVLRKATGRVPHGGGQPIAPGSEAEQTLRAWLLAGAPERAGSTHGSLVSLRVEPGDIRLDGPGPRQLRVVAEYADGHQRDVTRLASYRVQDDSVVQIDPLGKAHLLRRAETDLIVRYQSHVVSTRIATLIHPDLSFDFAALPRDNFIDEELLRRLESLRVPPSPPASDTAFLRRVTLDLTGQQPDPTEIRLYLDDPDPHKRARKVDELIASRDFVSFWQIKFGDLLQISPQRFPGGAGYYQMWLNERLGANAPWDQMVRELLTALGNPNEPGGGPVNYALDGADSKVAAEQTAQRFLGLRIRCAQCHDHPFDIWTQDDYFGLAAFFAKVERGAAAPGMMNRNEVRLNPDGFVEHLRTRRPAEPRLPGADRTEEIPRDQDPRKTLAEWITDPENPFFARAMANWVWAQFFGKGLADPPDDLSTSNPPVHPELLDALARHFVEVKYDLQALIRTIATSRVYALSSETVPGNEQDTRLFSHHIPRPLTAHQMADALAQATGVKDRYRLGGDGGRLVERRAIEIYDPTTPSPVLDAFGRCSRLNGCSAVATPSLSLRQALLVIGGTVVENKVNHLNGYLTHALDLSPEPVDLVENLYLRTVCRKPTSEESKHWIAFFEGKSGPELREAAEDLFWALLNSREFAFNH
jgi:hypothetical protein